MEPASALGPETPMVEKTMAKRNQPAESQCRIDVILFGDLTTDMILRILKKVEPAVKSDLFPDLSRDEVLRVAAFMLGWTPATKLNQSRTQLPAKKQFGRFALHCIALFASATCEPVYLH